MEKLYKCLEDFNSIHNTDIDALLDILLTGDDLFVQYSELLYLYENVENGYAEIQSLIKCILYSQYQVDHDPKIFKDFWLYIIFAIELELLLKKNYITTP